MYGTRNLLELFIAPNRAKGSDGGGVFSRGGGGTRERRPQGAKWLGSKTTTRHLATERPVRDREDTPEQSGGSAGRSASSWTSPPPLLDFGAGFGARVRSAPPPLAPTSGRDRTRQTLSPHLPGSGLFFLGGRVLPSWHGQSNSEPRLFPTKNKMSMGRGGRRQGMMAHERVAEASIGSPGSRQERPSRL